MQQQLNANGTDLAPIPPLAPVTQALCNSFQTKRIHFGRRRSHQNKHVLILHLNGVIASINLIQKVGGPNQDPLQPVSQNLSLRHECLDAIAELQ